MSTPDLADVELVKRARAGDDDAARELVRRHRSALFARIRETVQGRERAEWLLAESLAIALRRLDRYDPGQAFSGWVLGIADETIATSPSRTGMVRSPTLPYPAPAHDELAPESIIRMGRYHEARRGFASDQALASACSVGAAEVSLWRRGEATDGERLRMLRDLAIVVSRLIEYYQPEVVADWLYGNSPDLGGRPPLELLREGRLTEVLAAIEAQTSGAYV